MYIDCHVIGLCYKIIIDIVSHTYTEWNCYLYYVFTYLSHIFNFLLNTILSNAYIGLIDVYDKWHTTKFAILPSSSLVAFIHTVTYFELNSWNTFFFNSSQ